MSLISQAVVFEKYGKRLNAEQLAAHLAACRARAST